MPDSGGVLSDESSTDSEAAAEPPEDVRRAAPPVKAAGELIELRPCSALPAR